MTTPKPEKCLHHTFTLSVLLVVANFAFSYSGGTGEPNNPYQIANVADLLQLASDDPNYDKSFILTADINLAPNVFSTAVIAPGPGYPYTSEFTGNFDGGGHKISNLSINVSDPTDNLGLFGVTSYLYDLSEIKNLTLENVGIHVHYVWMVVGGLVGHNAGAKIANCHSSVSIIGEYPDTIEGGNFGGLVGYNSYYGNISNCSSAGDIFLFFNPYIHGVIGAGGLMGGSEGGTISDSHSDCNVIYNGDLDIWGGVVRLGGLVGATSGSIISNCYSTGIVSGNSPQEYYIFDIGGLLGEGYTYNFINRCFSSSPVIVRVDGYKYIGGLVGRNYDYSDINDCFSTGPVTVSYINNDYLCYTGGLVGDNHGQANILHCYSSGDVNSLAGCQYVGGLVGSQNESDINSSYFLNTSGPDNGLGEPLTDAQMKQQDSFTGWDFLGESINGTEDIWRMCFDNVNYPLLRWQFNRSDYICPDGVNFFDFAVFANYWLTENPFISLDEDDDIDIYDLKIFCNDWLEGASN